MERASGGKFVVTVRYGNNRMREGMKGRLEKKWMVDRGEEYKKKKIPSGY